MIETDISSSSNNSGSIYQQLIDKRAKLAERERRARILKAEITQMEALATEKHVSRAIEVMKAVETTTFKKVSLHKLAYLYEVKGWATASEPDVVHQTVKTWLSDQIKQLNESTLTVDVDLCYTAASKGLVSKTPSKMPFPPVGPEQLK
jgi:hypothetical protein